MADHLPQNLAGSRTKKLLFHMVVTENKVL